MHVEPDSHRMRQEKSLGEIRGTLQNDSNKAARWLHIELLGNSKQMSLSVIISLQRLIIHNYQPNQLEATIFFGLKPQQTPDRKALVIALASL